MGHTPVTAEQGTVNETTDHLNEGTAEPDQGVLSTPETPGANLLAAGSGTVIRFHYDLYDAGSQLIESSSGGDPVAFLFGQGHILAALQEVFVGKHAGEEFKATIGHESAYGRHYPDRIQRVSIKNIDGGKRQTFRAGQIINLEGQHGPRPSTIVKVGKFNLDVDGNHPLAGQDLTFEVTMVEVREATTEEVAHGHAHGPGGHHHG